MRLNSTLHALCYYYNGITQITVLYTCCCITYLKSTNCVTYVYSLYRNKDMLNTISLCIQRLFNYMLYSMIIYRFVLIFILNFVFQHQQELHVPLPIMTLIVLRYQTLNVALLNIHVNVLQAIRQIQMAFYAKVTIVKQHLLYTHHRYCLSKNMQD